ncbi:hypothetical protein Tco_0117153 [Tanacetum coccineum]|uniref:Uncharacterized protein n=1 Tax=Tanacetum coccineum TaxID=301880 RepID=A0ABQ4ZVI5_9ASTR
MQCEWKKEVVGGGGVPGDGEWRGGEVLPVIGSGGSKMFTDDRYVSCTHNVPSDDSICLDVQTDDRYVIVVTQDVQTDESISYRGTVDVQRMRSICNLVQ